MDVKTKLDQEIAETKAKLAKLETLREMLDDEYLEKFLKVSDNGQAVLFEDTKPPEYKVTTKIKRKRPVPRKKKGSVLVELIKFFTENDNEWATLKEICNTTGLKKDSVRQVLYRSNPDRFERDSEVGGGREAKFRLAN